MPLVTDEQARAHLRVDADEDISLYLGAAEDAVRAFLGRNVYPDASALADAVLDGSAGEAPMVANKAIMAATLLFLGDLYRDRENSREGSQSAVPTGAYSLLQPYRIGLGA